MKILVTKQRPRKIQFCYSPSIFIAEWHFNIIIIQNEFPVATLAVMHKKLDLNQLSITPLWKDRQTINLFRRFPNRRKMDSKVSRCIF